MNPLLEIQGLSCTYSGSSDPVLRQVDISLKAGECLCLTGPSGCGKTSLLKAVTGLLPPEFLSGLILWPGGGRPSIGMVLQNLDAQLLCTTVADEVAFAPQNQGLTPHQVSDRVERALALVGLKDYEQRNVEQLSAGQKSRLCLASVLTLEPGLLILDEPCGQLDRSGRERLVLILRGLKDRGHSILIAEHNLPALGSLVDRFAVLDPSGRLVSVTDSAPIPEMPEPETWPDKAAGDLVLGAEALQLDSPGGPLLGGADIYLRQGEAVHLFGKNGSGKSSLLACLAGLIRPDGGEIWFNGGARPRPGSQLGRISFLFQNPQRQLFEDSVEAEVGFTLGRLGLGRDQIKRHTEEALVMCELEHLARRAPLTLSFGEQHRVALAAAMAPRPELLICDEPLAGLDLAQRLRVISALAKMGRTHGGSLLVASHDFDPLAHWAARSLSLQGGAIAG